MANWDTIEIEYRIVKELQIISIQYCVALANCFSVAMSTKPSDKIRARKNGINDARSFPESCSKMCSMIANRILVVCRACEPTDIIDAPALSTLETSALWSVRFILEFRILCPRLPCPTCRHSQTFLLHHYIPYYPHACDDAGDHRKVALEP